jgi:hypothetical protein
MIVFILLLYFRYDDKYNLTLEYNDGIDKTTRSSQELSKSIGNYFDEDGNLCYDRFTTDLREIYDEARSNARKVK